jgi:hypothetical protein
VLGCAIAAQWYAAPEPPLTAGTDQPASHAERLHWVALAFVPSALMLAVTTYITTDIAATPLFWILPLAIYIGTFIVAFSRVGLIGQRPLLALQGIGFAAAALAGISGGTGVASLIIALSIFTLTALVCHRELANQRPNVRLLTDYYLMISIGGALGGAFCAAGYSCRGARPTSLGSVWRPHASTNWCRGSGCCGAGRRPRRAGGGRLGYT